MFDFFGASLFGFIFAKLFSTSVHHCCLQRNTSYNGFVPSLPHQHQLNLITPKTGVVVYVFSPSSLEARDMYISMNFRSTWSTSQILEQLRIHSKILNITLFCYQGFGT